MSSMRAITAAIPAYNAERYLGEALESVFAQTHPCHECIVVDDGSTDGTEDVARSFSNVRYISQENGGDANARNTAIREATGDFIAFLDSDDVWLPDKLEKQMALFEDRSDLAMAYTGVVVVDPSLKPLDVLRPAPSWLAFRNTLLVEKPYITGVGSTAVVPIQIARQVTFDERLSASADWAFACRVASRHAVAPIDEPLALYRQHEGVQVHRNLDAVERDMHLVWSELFSEDGFPSELRRLRRRAAANLNLSLAYSSYRQGSKVPAWKYLGRAFARRPDRVVAAFWRRYMG